MINTGIRDTKARWDTKVIVVVNNSIVFFFGITRCKVETEAS